MEEDELFLLNVLLADVEDAEEQVDDGPRLVLGREDPFQVLSENNFTKLFRLNKQTCESLLEDLTAIVAPVQRRISALDLKTNLLVTLLFYGHGSYQAITGSNLFAGMSQPSVSRSVTVITNALNNENFVNRWIKFPRNIRELTERRTKFYSATGIPGGIGVIDCTHVAIVRPSEEEHIYVNRKNYHSINVQLICDENLKIMHVNGRFPGSTHDAYIWNQSNVAHTMENIYRHNPQNNFFLLGDSGYPLRPWLLTPLRQVEPGTAEERFNNTFKTVRSTIERCNGVLKNRFRCLLKHRVLHYKPDKVAKIIKACAVLHNICIDNKIPEPDIDDERIIEDLGFIGGQPLFPLENRAANQDLVDGRQLRQRIINNYFN